MEQPRHGSSDDLELAIEKEAAKETWKGRQLDRDETFGMVNQTAERLSCPSRVQTPHHLALVKESEVGIKP